MWNKKRNIMTLIVKSIISKLYLYEKPMLMKVLLINGSPRKEGNTFSVYSANNSYFYS